MEDYEEFAISITHQSAIRYLVHAQGTVSAATAGTQMDLDLGSPGLREYLDAIRSGSIDKELLQRCGTFLFRKLFEGSIQTAYASHLKEAYERGRKGVRITLDFAVNSLELHKLPWMTLYDPERDLWVGELNSPLGTPLSISVPGQPPLQPVTEVPLRILVVGANPAELPPLDVNEEAAKIEKALFDLRKQGLINTELLSAVEGPITRARLYSKIEDWNPHILHIVGHGPQQISISTAGFYLEHEDKAPDFYPAKALQKTLQVWGRSVRFVVLSACNTALAARQLANKGIPAIGMAAPILGSAAMFFSHRLYESLIAHGLPLDEAVNRARSVVRVEQQEDECGWISPVLFLPQGKSIPLVPTAPTTRVFLQPSSASDEKTMTPTLASPRQLQELDPSRHRPWRWRTIGVWAAVPLALLLFVLIGQHLVTHWHRVPQDMARIPAGKFQKGGENTPMTALLRRFGDRVKLRELIKIEPKQGRLDWPFFIDDHEVTNESYAGFLGAHPHEPSGKDHTPATWGDARFNQSNQPVSGVDAYDADAYCKWAGKRLPTSDEWERAARGTDGRLYPWGNEFRKEDANTGEGPDPQPVAGGTYEPDHSPDGVYDLGGNVSEWTSTPDEIGGTAARALAGASWTDVGEIFALTFLRRATSLSYRGEEVGFRCARSAGSPDETPPVGMALIPAGKFTKGGEDSLPLNLIRHSNLDGQALLNVLGKQPERVWLGEFLLDRHEVTNREYGQFLQALTASRTVQGASSDKDHTPAYWQETQFNQPDQPVVGVDWQDANAFCTWNGKRLPTSNEWERAARGTDGRRYPWGNTFGPNRCNTNESLGEDQTSAVGSHRDCVSPEGVFDLVGNADEWTIDKPVSAEDLKDPRVIRGGGWNDPGELRGLGYVEIAAAADYRGKELGFRCAKTPQSSWLEQLAVWISRFVGSSGRD